MGGIKDQEKIEELRNRLYQRGTSGVGNVHHSLSDEETPVPTSWDITKKYEQNQSEVPIPEAVPETYEPVLGGSDMKKNKKRGYRVKLALVGVIFFGIAMVISSFFLVFGRNSISGDNISLVLTIPFTVGGGEVLPMQVGIRNDNTVPMEAATLIIEYPPGTKSVEDTPRDLHTERIPLDTIQSGEFLNMPLRVTVFGEENEEKVIKASIEYRVQGSGARFFKEAEPQSFRVSSAPVSFRVDGLKRVSSGQESSHKVTIVSNSLTPLSEVMVKVDYPVGFEFVKSDPPPSSGQNTWIIKDVNPETQHSITITGKVIGQETDQHVMNFSAGIPNERDKNNFASVFANASTEFEIEPAFLDIGVTMGDESGESRAINKGDSTGVNITINNTLPYSVYDMRTVVTLSGNAFIDSGVQASKGGYYDSANNTILWDVANTYDFDQLRPGATRNIKFDVKPNSSIDSNPQVTMKIDVFARRVAEGQVNEELLGSVVRTVKVNSEVDLLTSASHGTQPFSDSGPVPPQVGETTTYTISSRIENGANAVRGAKVSMSLPVYVKWLDNTSGTGSFEYNQTNKTLTWQIGDIAENASASASFQVSLLPSTSQIGKTPVLVNDQTLTATDTFTNDSVVAENDEVETTLSREAGFGQESGVVQP